MHGYIAELRQLIGHRPILMVGAGVLIIDEEGRLLLQYRSDNHTWCIPGGSTEPGETLEETAIRESHEETGLHLDELKLFGVFSGAELYYEYPNGDQVYNVSVVFECKRFHGDLETANEESLGLRFFSPWEIQMDQISPPVQPILRKWSAGINKE